MNRAIRRMENREVNGRNSRLNEKRGVNGMQSKMVNVGGVEIPEEMIQSITRNAYKLLSSEPILLMKIISGSMRGDAFIEDLVEELSEVVEVIMPGRMQNGPAAAFTLEVIARIHVKVAQEIMKEKLK